MHHGAAHHSAGSAAHALQHAACNQRVEAGCRRSNQRADGQQGEAGQEHAFAAIPVRERAVDQLAHAIRDHKPAEGQLHLRLAGAEQRAPLLHGRQANRHRNQAEGELGEEVGEEHEDSLRA